MSMSQYMGPREYLIDKKADYPWEVRVHLDPDRRINPVEFHKDYPQHDFTQVSILHKGFWLFKTEAGQLAFVEECKKRQIVHYIGG